VCVCVCVCVCEVYNGSTYTLSLLLAHHHPLIHIHTYAHAHIQRDVVLAQNSMSSFGNLTKTLQAQLRVSNAQRMELRAKHDRLVQESNEKTKGMTLASLEMSRNNSKMAEMRVRALVVCACVHEWMYVYVCAFALCAYM
jgi:zona occludens toxin (predicted ATPase)